MKILSQSEISIWNNAEIFITKQKITNFIYDANALIIEEIKTSKPILHSNFKFNNPKISKGENYNCLPWVMADYPAYFDKENIFAFRMFYLWGAEINFFLVLKGDFLKHYQTQILSQIKNQAFTSIKIYVGADVWKHNMDEDYKLIEAIEIEKIIAHINQFGFLKLAIYHPSTKINEIEKLGFNAWQLFYKLLSA
jgi:hypothetical protein